MKTKNSKEQLTPDNMESQSLEVSMLNKDNFSDKELESYLSKGEIKATDKITIPPKILFVTLPLPLSAISMHPQVRQRARKPSISQQW